MRLFTGKERKQGHLPSLLLHTSFFVSNPVFDVGSGQISTVDYTFFSVCFWVLYDIVVS